MWTESRKLPLLLLSQPSGKVRTGLKMVLNLSVNLLQVFWIFSCGEVCSIFYKYYRGSALYWMPVTQFKNCRRNTIPEFINIAAYDIGKPTFTTPTFHSAIFHLM